MEREVALDFPGLRDAARCCGFVQVDTYTYTPECREACSHGDASKCGSKAARRSVCRSLYAQTTEIEAIAGKRPDNARSVKKHSLTQEKQHEDDHDLNTE